MGLCKCPKKKVTNLFCFEHRVNVCEHCLVENHPSCVVQSYLQWLTDSDFDVNCTLCQHPLSTGETVRLQCLHVLHWQCLDAYAHRLPATTAPAGYRCPCCSEAIFPSPNQTSPTIEVLRSVLLKANWARVGLGLPALPELASFAGSMPQFVLPDHDHGVPPPPIPVLTSQQYKPSNMSQGQSHPVYEATPTHINHNYRSATPATALEVDDVAYSVGGSADQVTFTARKKHGHDEDTRPLISNDRDTDSQTNKYKRRPAKEWLRGLWRAKYGTNGPQDQFTGYKRTLFIMFLCIILLVTVITVLTSFGGSEDDPLLDPKFNPNIRIAAADDSIGNHI